MSVVYAVKRHASSSALALQSDYPIRRTPSVGYSVRRCESLPTIGDWAQYTPAGHRPYGSWKQRRHWDIFEYGWWQRYYNVSYRGWNTYSSYTYAPYRRQYHHIEPTIREYRKIYEKQLYPALYLYTPYRNAWGYDFSKPVYIRRNSDLYLDRPKFWYKPYRRFLHEANDQDKALQAYSQGLTTFRTMNYYFNHSTVDKRLQALKTMYGE